MIETEKVLFKNLETLSALVNFSPTTFVRQKQSVVKCRMFRIKYVFVKRIEAWEKRGGFESTALAWMTKPRDEKEGEKKSSLDYVFLLGVQNPAKKKVPLTSSEEFLTIFSPIFIVLFLCFKNKVH